MVGHSSVALLLVVLVVSLVWWPFSATAWMTLANGRRHDHHSFRQDTRRLRMSWKDLVGDVLTGGRLIPQSSLPYEPPLAQEGTTMIRRRTLAIQERALSWTGEDFDIVELHTSNNSCYCRVRGAMLWHLPGKDKMRFVQGGTVVATLERKLVALSPTYDIYRGDDGTNQKWGWMEKAKIALTDTFEVHVQGQAGGGFGILPPPAAYRLEGDFLDRRFVMKNVKGEVVAKVSKDQLVEFDAFNHYRLEVAPGMDPILCCVCACAIDEELDQEHQQKKKQQQQQREQQ